MADYIQYSHEALCLLLEHKDCEIDRLCAHPAERDWEIARLKQQSVGWVAVFDENDTLLAEVERLQDSQCCVACDDFQGYKNKLTTATEALRIISTQAIEPAYCYDIAVRLHKIAAQALKEVEG